MAGLGQDGLGGVLGCPRGCGPILDPHLPFVPLYFVFVYALFFSLIFVSFCTALSICHTYHVYLCTAVV